MLRLLSLAYVVEHRDAARRLHDSPEADAIADCIKGAKLGRSGEARQEFEQAASLTRNASERTLFLDRAAQLSASP